MVPLYFVPSNLISFFNIYGRADGMIRLFDQKGDDSEKIVGIGFT